MSLTIIVTSNAELRFQGYLGSMMLEVAPGTYVSPRLNRDARERVWEVLEDWHRALPRASIVMIWRDKAYPGNIGLKMLGVPRREFVDVDNLLLTRRVLSK